MLIKGDIGIKTHSRIVTQDVKRACWEDPESDEEPRDGALRMR